tara:strand:+ start:11521 stop:11697 length:177 start_codon:yes stop_codon:yes gene_type:complete
MNLLKKMIKEHKRMDVKTKELTETRRNDRSMTSWVNLKDLKKMKLRTKDKINEIKQKF